MTPESQTKLLGFYYTRCASTSFLKRYPPIKVKIFSKDLGKKWFGFTLMENTDADEIIGRL